MAIRRSMRTDAILGGGLDAADERSWRRKSVDVAVRHALKRLSHVQPIGIPFRHVVADGLFDDDLLEDVADEFPRPNSPLWFCYDSPLEKKLCSNRLDLWEPLLAAFVRRLNSPDVATAVGKLFGIEGLVVDPSLHGTGLHLIEPGGKLDIHLDFADHPKLLLTRRVNLVLYLNEDWLDSWGGSLELWDAELTCPIVRITPLFNRLLLFEVHDHAYHGHPDPLTPPDGRCRESISLCFLTAREAAAPGRQRARFVARPQDAPDAHLDELRRQRAQLVPQIATYLP